MVSQYFTKKVSILLLLLGHTERDIVGNLDEIVEYSLPIFKFLLQNVIDQFSARTSNIKSRIHKDHRVVCNF